MRDLTEADKAAILDRIDNLGPEHWAEVKLKFAAMEAEFLTHRKALSVSDSKLKERFDI